MEKENWRRHLFRIGVELLLITVFFAVLSSAMHATYPVRHELAVKEYSVVGDLQTLYGGENGYPQAVLVAKNTVLSAKENFVKAFAEKLENAQAWLAVADGAEIVSAVNANLDKTLSSTSLTAEKIDEWKDYCGVRYEYAAAMQERTQAFLAELIAVNAASTTLPNAAFYWSYTK